MSSGKKLHLNHKKTSKKRGKSIAKAIIDILNSNKAILARKLSGQERGALNDIRADLEWGCTGKWRKPTTAWPNFGQFNHLIFQLPGNHGKLRFKYEEKTVLKFRDALWNVLYEFFGVPDNRIGLYMRPHPQCTDDREPEFHFHVLQSKHFFKWEDRSFMEKFNALPEDDKPLYSLYLLHQAVVTEPQELAALLEEKWRQAIFETTGRKVSKEHSPLVNVISRNKQKKKDRKRAANYLRNPALKSFKDKWVKDDPKLEGHALLIYGKEAGGGENRTVSIPVEKFVRRYLLLPNKNLEIRWYPKGPVRYSKFQPILRAAERLLARHQGRMIPILNLPIHLIVLHAELFRKHYEAEGAAGIEKLKAKYEIV